MTTTIETDYLVIGAGAMGMAFTDTLISETHHNVIIVDRYGQPGGHWTTSYPFVRLHQPSAFYGVNSRPLGNGAIDPFGWNEGLYELASGQEVCAYFDEVMRQQLIPSGRVTYYPMHDYQGDGRIKSLVSGEAVDVRVRERTVDSTYMRVTVPSMRPAPYDIAPGTHSVPLNDLPKLRGPYDHYTVIGAGKTGMDACLWLLWHGADPANLTWIMPRDPWMLDRALVQPGEEFAGSVGASAAAEAAAIAEATSIQDLFERLDAAGRLIRLTDQVTPTMFRCATVTQAELAQLRRIKDIVRLGHVQSIGLETIMLDKGTIATSRRTLHIHCTADALEKRPSVPVFDGSNITLQTLRACQQGFSAAIIAYVEATYFDDAAKNDLCSPVPHPDDDLDFLRTRMGNARNELRWSEEPAMVEWLENARLNFIGHLRPRLPDETDARALALEEFRARSRAAIQKLEGLLSAKSQR